MKINKKVIFFKKLDSTNSQARFEIDNGNDEDGLVIWTKEQTLGKGRGSNNWHSQAGKNLSLSIVFKPYFIEASKHFYLHLFISLSIIDFLKNYIPKNKLSIKWPNDIYVGNKKICGILICNDIVLNNIENSIIGIGININQDNFPDEIPNATSLKIITNKIFDLNECLSNLVKYIYSRYEQLKNTPEKLHKEYVDLLFQKNLIKTYIIKGIKTKAEIINIDKAGKLILKVDNKLISCDIDDIKYK